MHCLRHSKSPCFGHSLDLNCDCRCAGNESHLSRNEGMLRSAIDCLSLFSLRISQWYQSTIWFEHSKRLRISVRLANSTNSSVSHVEVLCFPSLLQIFPSADNWPPSVSRTWLKHFVAFKIQFVTSFQLQITVCLRQVIRFASVLAQNFWGLVKNKCIEPIIIPELSNLWIKVWHQTLMIDVEQLAGSKLFFCYQCCNPI